MFINFCAMGSFLRRVLAPYTTELGASDYLLKDFSQSENGLFSCVPFCLRSLRASERCEYYIYLKLCNMFFILLKRLTDDPMKTTSQGRGPKLSGLLKKKTKRHKRVPPIKVNYSFLLHIE